MQACCRAKRRLQWLVMHRAAGKTLTCSRRDGKAALQGASGQVLVQLAGAEEVQV